MKMKFLRAYATKLAAERGGPVTTSEAESEVVRVIGVVAHNLGDAFTFGYHAREDTEQQVAVYCLEALDRYDVGRPLENFLYVHARNQMSNLKRKHFFRYEAPCVCCDAFGRPEEPCRRWLEWSRRNAAKQGLMRPLDIAAASEDEESSLRDEPSVADEAALGETLGLIDALLDPDLRSDYLRMRGSVPIPKVRRNRVREAILEILGAD